MCVWESLYSVRLGSPTRIALLTAGYKGLFVCNVKIKSMLSRVVIFRKMTNYRILEELPEQP